MFDRALLYGLYRWTYQLQSVLMDICPDLLFDINTIGIDKDRAQGVAYSHISVQVLLAWPMPTAPFSF